MCYFFQQQKGKLETLAREDFTHLPQVNSVLQKPRCTLKLPDKLVWVQERASSQKSCYMLELGLQTSSDRIVTRCFISTLALKCQDSRCIEQLLLNLLLHSCLLGKYLSSANKVEKPIGMEMLNCCMSCSAIME